jgi:uncharacterized protein (TIGR02594 family)
MASLPKEYGWLAEVPDKPRMITEALRLYGVHEGPGSKDNPVILGWAHEIGGSVDDAYLHDEVPWCGLFMAVVAHRAAKPVPVNPLWALNWAKFGRSASPPSLGDVLVFTRPGGKGHVGLYVAEDQGNARRGPAFHVLGGNQADQVGIVAIERSRLYAARRPVWEVAQPPSVTPRYVTADGKVSVNEA